MNPHRTLALVGLTLLASAGGCRFFRGERPDRGESKTEEPATKDGTKAVSTEKGAAKAKDPDEPAGAAEEGDAPAKGDGKPLVLMIVMDTVRADHLSMCGYDRPTSPYLESLVKKGKVAHTCKAHSPGPWTVPSHASYFTGLSVPEHGSDAMGVQFSETIPTIGEIMSQRGYQPVLLSANPTLSVESGLQRGFKHIDVGRTLSDMRGDEVKKRLRKLLGEIKADKPMFLVVNLIDAHDPYPRIPPDVGWVPAQETMVYDVHDKERDTPYHKYFKGELTPEREREYEERARNGYDYGISLADKNVEEVMRVLRQEGWLGHGFRIVITADHGEYLGEHHLLRHGSYLWEPVTNVPFVYYDSSATTPLALPDPFSSLHAFSLLTEGRLPETMPPVSSFANEREADIKRGADMVAVWSSPTEKIMWEKGEFFRIDLAADKTETTRLPLPTDHPQRAALEKMAADHTKHLAEVRGKEVDPALKAQLVKLGYWETPEGAPPPEEGAVPAAP